jgi:hypothetical protein
MLSFTTVPDGFTAADEDWAAAEVGGVDEAAPPALDEPPPQAVNDNPHAIAAAREMLVELVLRMWFSFFSEVQRGSVGSTDGSWSWSWTGEAGMAHRPGAERPVRNWGAG